MLGIWLVTGAVLDAWAHVNDPEIDPFFTLWHGVMYSGFIALLTWTARGFARRATTGVRLTSGQKITLLGLGLFAAGGIGDLLWHQVFGLEVQLGAVVSPPHIALLAAGVVVLSAPARAAWRREGSTGDWRSLLPVLLSVTAATTMIALAFFHVSPFVPTTAGGFLKIPTSFDDSVTNRLAAYSFERSMLVGILVADFLLFTPLLLIMRRWRIPPGFAGVFVMLNVIPLVGVGGFRMTLPLWTTFVGVLWVEALLVFGRAVVTPWVHLRAFAFVGSMFFWLIFTIGLVVGYGIPLPADLLVGAPLWAGGLSFGCASLLTLRYPAQAE